jgi:hypothetical protein
MVYEFADLWEASNHNLTLTGSYIQDREEYPGFYRCVLERLAIKTSVKKDVEETLKAVRSNG